MRKKIFVPTDEQLNQMQVLGGDIYRYLLTKVVETEIMNAKYSNSKILNENSDDCVIYNSDIVRAICRIYPEEINNVNWAKNDVNLCLSLLNRIENSNYDLDNLSLFSNRVQQNDIVRCRSIHFLEKQLKSNPKYRFDYINSELLDSIFSVGIKELTNNVKSAIEPLINIEPVYGLTLECSDTDKAINERINLIKQGISNYAKRYNIGSDSSKVYANKDINENSDVKKLLKIVRKNNDIIY